jgi:hypothetical protein
MTAVRCAFLAAALLSSTAMSAEPRLDKLVRYDAGDFTIFTSRGENQARQFIEELSKFRVTLEALLGKRATPNPFPTHILITSAGDWDEFLQPRDNIAGFFQSGRFSNYISMNGDVHRDFALPLVFHEYTHFYLATQFAGEYPPWFNEGLAELMAWAKFTQNDTVVLQIPRHHAEDARLGDWITFDRLIKVDNYSPEYQSHKLMPSFYAQSWLTVNYGLVENREFGKQFITYLRELNTLKPQPEAARTAFGEDLAAIDKQLRDYSRNSKKGSGSMSLRGTPPVTLPKGVPVSENDAYAIYIDLMLESRLGPNRVRPLVEALSRREPNSARAAIFEARLASADEDSAAFSRAVDKAEAALVDGDWESRRELGAVVLLNSMDSNPLRERSAADNERDLKRAFKHYAQAIAHNSADLEALWGFGTAAARLNQNLDLAEQALIAAYQLAPSSAMIAMSLAELKGRSPEPDAMIPYLKDTIRYATDLGTKRWGVETLRQMQTYIERRDAANAAYEKEVAEYEKKYGKTKKRKQR